MKKKTNYQKYYMKQAIELHSSLWLEDMRKLKVSDFLKGGIMTIDPYVLNGPEDVLITLTKKFWNVIYLTNDFVEKGYGTPGFMYLIDTENGLDIFHNEPLRKVEVVNKPINLERAML
jgi:hypothetical protein